MLTSAQCQPVAYMLPDDCEFLCRQCTLEAIGYDEDGEFSDDVAKAEMGLPNESEVRVVIEYELSEYASETLWERCREDTETDEEAQELFDASECQEWCGGCGTELL